VSAPRRLAWLAALAFLCAAAARAEEPAPEDPPLCRDALAAQPQQSALDALARAEEGAARRGRAARAQARTLMRKHLGAGQRDGLAASDAAEALLRQAADASREGKVLCHCRQRRGDTNRQDCEALYPEKLP
jgi:hypothetical protein